MYQRTIERWKTKINKNSIEFQKNYNEMKKLVEELNERLEESRNQGKIEHLERHIKAGKLLARDRIELILDEDSPFLELMPLAGWGQDESVGAGIVCGIGLICGVECIISASIPTIKGGSINPISLEKSRRLAEIALENRLPSITLLQSAGADLRQQSLVFHRGGGTFRDLSIRSKQAIPTICVVFGNSTAGGAYTPGLSDYVIMVKNQAKVFLGGPPLVKMATGEEVDDETLGGAEMHSKVSGVSDFLASNEYHALRLAREIVHNLNYKKKTELPNQHFTEIEEPFYDIDEILGIVSPDISIPFDSREVISRIVDGSRFSEFKPLYGSTLVTGFSRIHGIPIGILANNGVLFSEAANKGAQFIQLCNQSNTPLLFLQNITGFMVGKKYEQEGIIKHGSKLINSISNSGVPAITIIIGASYGAGNYGMCGRAYRPRFLFSWMNSKCAVMGPDQLSGVMDIVMQSGMERAGQLDEKTKQMAEMKKEIMRQKIVEEGSSYYTTSRIIDDGLIDPRNTRNIVGFCLSIIYNNDIKGANLFGVSRL